MEFTYDPTPADQVEFSPDELDSLQVGENLEAAQEQMLAGKYENAEQLERAYLELQQKLGNPDRGDEQGDVPEEELEDQDQEAEEDQEIEYSEAERAILEASQEYYSEDGLSEETYNQLSQMDTQELLDTYLQLQQQQQPEPTPDLSDSDVNSIYGFAGGADQYNAITQWAGQNMDPSFVNAYDRVVESGDPASIQLALAGLMATYYENNGYEGRMYSGGRGEVENAPSFRSQAEVIEAMNDPRYEIDPAYRQDVFDALERSNINY
jgi:hypothetical protein